MNTDKTALRELLHEHIIIVQHKNSNGEQRQRHVTLATAAIPTEHQPKTGRETPTHLTRVFDVKLQQWRTLINDTVEILAYKRVEV